MSSNDSVEETFNYIKCKLNDCNELVVKLQEIIRFIDEKDELILQVAKTIFNFFASADYSTTVLLVTLLLNLCLFFILVLILGFIQLKPTHILVRKLIVWYISTRQGLWCFRSIFNNLRDAGAYYVMRLPPRENRRALRNVPR